MFARRFKAPSSRPSTTRDSIRMIVVGLGQPIPAAWLLSPGSRCCCSSFSHCTIFHALAKTLILLLNLLLLLSRKGSQTFRKGSYIRGSRMRSPLPGSRRFTGLVTLQMMRYGRTTFTEQSRSILTLVLDLHSIFRANRRRLCEEHFPSYCQYRF